MPKRVFSFIFFISLTISSPIYAVNLNSYLKEKFNNTDSLKSKNDLVRNAAQFYKKRDFKQFWVDGNGFTATAETVAKVLKEAASEGLDPSDYRKAIELMSQAKKNPKKLLDAEIALTAFTLEYIDDVLGERLNPRKIGKELYLKAKKIDAVQIMTDSMAQDSSGDWLGKLTIHHPEYQLLKKALANYRARNIQNNYPKISNGKKIELRSTGGRVETLQWQLSALGYLTGKYTQGSVDLETEAAIKAFQEENHLKVDGSVGPITVGALNAYNPEERIKQIIVSMERWRWLPEDLGKRYVFVNIAGFDLVAIDNNIEKLRMPVIIGKPYHKTPVFSSKIYSIRFNPSWHVPRSIAVNEKLKKLRKDPEYLNRNGYVLYDSEGGQINSESVDWHSVSASNFNYRIRQRPGDNNALGKIRFAIENPFNVYLHSTPGKHLFKEKLRSLSHGCIRLGDPQSLAVFVFNDQKKWPYGRVVKSMEGTNTQNIPVENPVNVYISYFTVWKNKEGKLSFSQDIYNQDKAIWTALETRKRIQI